MSLFPPLPPGFERAFERGLPWVVLAGFVAELAAVRGAPRAWVETFSLSYEQNVPTWYATGLLLLASIALADAATVADAGLTRRGFVAFSAAFAYLSLDEAIEIHEYASSLYAGHGVLHFGWVVPAALVVAFVGAMALPWLRALPSAPRRAFVIAGVVYVGGAVGMELPLGLYTERHGSDTLGYGLIDGVEEALELIGIALFLRAVRAYAREAGTYEPGERATP